jgi:hypothetical protein
MGNLPQVPFSFHSFRGAYISFFQDKRGMHPTPRALNRVQKANPPFESPWQDHSFFITNTPEQTIHIPLEEDEVQIRFRILSR